MLDPSFAFSRVERKFPSFTHDVRATLECDPLRLLRNWGWTLIVRRPKPLIPLTTAPHRVSANSKNSFPAATVARRLPIRASANKGAMIAIAASDRNSFVVIAFMRFCVASLLCLRCGIASLTKLVFTRPMPCTLNAMNSSVRLVFDLVDESGLSLWVYKNTVRPRGERLKGVDHLTLLLVCLCVARG